MANQITRKILELADVQRIVPEKPCLAIIPEEHAVAMQTVVFDRYKQVLHIVTTNKYPDKLKTFLAQLEEQNFTYELYYTSEEGIAIAFRRYLDYKQEQEVKKIAIKAQQTAYGETAIAMIKKVYEKRNTMNAADVVMELVKLGFQAGASDLHFQPEDRGVVMRLRIDGVLQEILCFTHKDFFAYLKKLKFIAGTKMNVDYIPQDGRFTFEAHDTEGKPTQIDVRANFMPGNQSESTVMRYLDSSKSIQSFENLGFQGKNREIFDSYLQHNFGLILITGPTGSGKTTTLYSVLAKKNTGTEKIITLEDPIEYQLSGIQQSQINYRKGYDYVEGLNSCMRHDPDIILVGETRTLSTAETVINAALTGHLVFTTLHTNSAIETITRLLSMGIEPYMLAPSLLLIEAQRLVRKVCPHCVVRREVTASEKKEIELQIKKIQEIRPDEKIVFDGTVPSVVGCPFCQGAGYKGRIGVVEVLSISEEIREKIVENMPEKEILAVAQKQGFCTLQQDAYLKVLQGITTLEEIRRVV